MSEEVLEDPRKEFLEKLSQDTLVSDDDDFITFPNNSTMFNDDVFDDSDCVQAQILEEAIARHLLNSTGGDTYKHRRLQCHQGHG